MWGIRVVVPSVLQNEVLNLLHEAHIGVVRMKMLARSYVYWPSLDKDIEKLAQTCNECVNKQKAPPKSPLHPWKFPRTPWYRVHIDFEGPFQGHMFLLLQDAHSKFPEIAVMRSTTSEKTIEVLHTWFSRFGLVSEIVSDNGPQFTTDLFKSFCTKYGIRHIRSSIYHASTNGMIERLVGSLKGSLKCQKNDSISMQKIVCKFLFSYRNTPHATTGEVPAVLMFGRRLRSKIDLLKPDLTAHVQSKQYVSPKVHRKMREFEEKEKVLVRDYRDRTSKWKLGKIKYQQ